MNIKNTGKTKIAFFVLLLHFAYVALCALFMLITTLLEFPCDRGGIYLVFSGISMILLCIFPLVTTGINATSMVFQILALHKNESKIKNIIMMAIAILYESAVIVFFICFWQGAMGA